MDRPPYIPAGKCEFLDLLLFIWNIWMKLTRIISCTSNTAMFDDVWTLKFEKFWGCVMIHLSFEKKITGQKPEPKKCVFKQSSAPFSSTYMLGRKFPYTVRLHGSRYRWILAEKLANARLSVLKLYYADGVSPDSRFDPCDALYVRSFLSQT